MNRSISHGTRDLTKLSVENLLAIYDETSPVVPDQETEAARIRNELRRRVRAGDAKAYQLVFPRLRRVAGGVIMLRACEQVRLLEATARPINAVSARDFIVAKLKELNPHWGQAGPEAQVRKPRRKKHKATKKKPQLTEHEKPLWELIRRRLQGPQYCRGADELRISPPWKDCPPTYVAVYKLEGKWRHRIEAERSRIKRKMENLTKLTKNISREEK